jgi:hypothetical protein
MPSRADMLGQRAIGGEKALGLSWGLEALQAPLALAGRLVGKLRAVIHVVVLPVFHPRQDLLFRCIITFPFVGDDDAWNILAAFEELTEERLDGDLTAPSLPQHIEHSPLLVDGPPQVVTYAVNGQKHRIQMPRVPRSGVLTLELVGIGVPERPAPLTNGFIGDHYASYTSSFFDVAVAEAEADIPPDAMADDLGWETMVLLKIQGWWAQTTNMAHQGSAGQATQQVDHTPAPYPLKKKGMISTKRIFTIVMPGKIMA